MKEEQFHHPDEELDAISESDAAALSDELGQIGLHTVDGDKLKAPVEKIDMIDDDTVRLWYRYPTGEFIPETFERPLFWDVKNSKLARIADYAGVKPETFSNLETQDDIQIVLEETKVPKSLTDIESLASSAPTPTGFDGEEEDPLDILYFDEGTETEYSTWQAVDPRDFAEDDRYEKTDSDEEDTTIELFERAGVTREFFNVCVTGGAMTFVFFGLVYLLVTGVFSLLPGGVPSPIPGFRWLAFAVLAVLFATWFARAEENGLTSVSN